MRPAPLATLHPVAEQAPEHHVLFGGWGERYQAEARVVLGQQSQLVLGVVTEHAPLEPADDGGQVPAPVTHPEQRRIEPGAAADHHDLQAGQMWQQAKPAVQLPVGHRPAPSQVRQPRDPRRPTDAELGAGRHGLEGPPQTRSEAVIQVEQELTDVGAVWTAQPDRAEAAGQHDAAVQRLIKRRGQDGAGANHPTTTLAACRGMRYRERSYDPGPQSHHGQSPAEPTRLWSRRMRSDQMMASERLRTSSLR